MGSIVRLAERRKRLKSLAGHEDARWRGERVLTWRRRSARFRAWLAAAIPTGAAIGAVLP